MKLKKLLDTGTYTLANWLSASRVFLLPLLVFLLIYDNRLWFTLLLSFIFFTDWLDGFIASKLNQETERGDIA